MASTRRNKNYQAHSRSCNEQKSGKVKCLTHKVKWRRPWELVARSSHNDMERSVELRYGQHLLRRRTERRLLPAGPLLVRHGMPASELGTGWLLSKRRLPVGLYGSLLGDGSKHSDDGVLSNVGGPLPVFFRGLAEGWV